MSKHQAEMEEIQQEGVWEPGPAYSLMQRK
jgi:hypothetical protein